MIKKLGILFLGILVFCISPAFAADINVKLYCPNSVNAGSALYLTKVVIYNNDWESGVTLNRYAAGIVGNYNNVLNAGRVYGPYAKTMTSRTILPESSVTITNLPIVSPVSTDLKGKMALVVVEFINGAGQSIGGDTCLVNVQ
ncbi:hypothetical protein SAMN04489760_14022 [Syntrophus gentianae]|uniref:Uncharacterized protein n=1 Tax=Syntrophus gentianae TaxID=43775 RepID=A0A1H8ATF8_9BACT|nr:hypothetical protein [Syntrophus gentianae]SEM73843.1 hypothetical protein SAMN04489760_14022 [Syntrophus gentianae]